MEKKKHEKVTALLRNAEISQSEELLKKELRIEQDEVNELSDKVNEMEVKLKSKNSEISQLIKKIRELMKTLEMRKVEAIQLTFKQITQNYTKVFKKTSPARFGTLGFKNKGLMDETELHQHKIENLRDSQAVDNRTGGS